MKYFLTYDKFLFEAVQAPSNNTEKITLKPSELQKKLDEWNITYSQSFKFENDQPKNPKNLDTKGVIVTNLIKMVGEGLRKLIDILSSNKDFIGKVIYFEGHTSKPASDSYNLELSKRRSQYIINQIMIKKDLALIVNIIDNNNSNPQPTTFKLDPTKINFVSVPKGESEPIIDNDEDKNVKDTSQLKGKAEGGKIMTSIISTLNDEQKKELISNLDYRQSFNRRVVVTLPGFPELPPKIVEIKTETPTTPPNEIATPQLNIKFNPNSYIQYSNTDGLINEYFEKIKVAGTIKKVCLAIAINLGKETDSEVVKRQRKAMFIIVCNRGFKAKQLLSTKFQSDPTTKEIVIEYYPFIQGKSTNVDATESTSKDFCKTINDTELQNVKNSFQNILNESGMGDIIKIGTNGECVMQNLIENIPLKDILIRNLKSYSDFNKQNPNDLYPKEGRGAIPLELWDSQYARDKNEIENFLKNAKEILGDDNLLKKYFLQVQGN